MNANDFELVIASFRNGNTNTFTSHDFINKFVYDFNEQYQELLNKYKGSKRITHSLIANYLRYHASELGITRNASKAKTFNVNGNVTESRVWSH